MLVQQLQDKSVSVCVIVGDSPQWAAQLINHLKNFLPEMDIRNFEIHRSGKARDEKDKLLKIVRAGRRPEDTHAVIFCFVSGTSSHIHMFFDESINAVSKTLLDACTAEPNTYP